MYTIGIDLGGTRIKGVLVNAAGEILQQAFTPTNDGDDSVWKNAVATTVQTLKNACPGPVQGIGLSAPGLPNEQNECIAFMPGRLQGLENFRWSDFLGEKTFVLNDAHSALLAEMRFGVGRGLKNVILLTLGTGVGGGIVLDGKLHQGFFQKAGSIGHLSVNALTGVRDITGMPGSIEDAIGNCTVEQRSLGRFSSTHDLLNAYEQGDHWATFVWLNSVQQLAVTVCGLINVFSPDAVVLGGGITQAGEHLFGPLRTFMGLYEWRPGGHATQVLRAEHIDLSGALGAASFAFEKTTL